MQIFDTNDARCIIDALKGQLVPSQFKHRDRILKQLELQVNGGEPRPDGWAPIRGSWPQNVTHRERKGDQFFKRQGSDTGKPAKQPKVPLTAQQILDSISK